MIVTTFVLAFISPFTVLAIASGTLPKIQVFRHSFTQMIGESKNSKSLELECYTTGNPQATITFEYNNVIIDNTSRVKRINKNRIRIENVSYGTDEGYYKCIASNENGVVFKRQMIKIDTEGMFLPGNSDIDPTETILVTLGKSLQLPCPEHTKIHPVKYRWGSMNGRRTKYMSENKRVTILENGLLYISSVHQEDIDLINKEHRGISCIIVSKGERLFSKRMVFQKHGIHTMNISPMVGRHFPRNTYIKKSSSKSLRCFGRGNPTPGISWFRDGEQINTNDSRFQMNPYLPGTLTIENFDKSLEGQYKCVLRNNAGVDQTATDVHLAEPPTIKTLFEEKQIQRNNGLKLDCEATGTLPLTYQWYRNGKLLTSYSTRNATMSVDKNILTINYINYNHIGRYQCFVFNEFGEASNFSNVVVVEPKYSKGQSKDSHEDFATLRPTKNGNSNAVAFGLEMKYIIIIACSAIVALMLVAGGLVMYCRKRNEDQDVHFIPTKRPDMHPSQDLSNRPIYAEPTDYLPPPPRSLTDYSDDDDDDDSSYFRDTTLPRKHEFIEIMDDIRAKQQSPLIEKKQKHEHFYYDIPEYLYENSSNAPSTEL